MVFCAIHDRRNGKRNTEAISSAVGERHRYRCKCTHSPRTTLTTYQQEQESQRAARLRNNKRRNRQRQKDYTSSLETKLRELQSQGVQATQEVQLSARKVVEDNTRLKALLRHMGVANHVIETWKPDAACQPPEKPSGCEKKWAGALLGRKVSRRLFKIDSSVADINRTNQAVWILLPPRSESWSRRPFRNSNQPSPSTNQHKISIPIQKTSKIRTASPPKAHP